MSPTPPQPGKLAAALLASMLRTVRAELQLHQASGDDRLAAIVAHLDGAIEGLDHIAESC